MSAKVSRIRRAMYEPVYMPIACPFYYYVSLENSWDNVGEGNSDSSKGETFLRRQSYNGDNDDHEV
jgi:hypothetical protein